MPMASGDWFRECGVLLQNPGISIVWWDEAWGLKWHAPSRFRISRLNGELAVSEFWDLERVIVGLVDSFL